MKNTNELLEESEQETMAKLNSIVNEYYQKYKQAGQNRNLTINHVEQFLMDCKVDVDKVLIEASTDILKKMEGSMVEKKKSVPAVEQK